MIKASAKDAATASTSPWKSRRAAKNVRFIC